MLVQEKLGTTATAVIQLMVLADSFRSKELIQPFGEVGKPEEVQEERTECVCDRDQTKGVIAAMRKVHPYEEVAFDIYPLISEDEL